MYADDETIYSLLSSQCELSADVQTKILQALYRRWFENWIIGLDAQQILEIVQADENQVSHAISLLDTHGYIEKEYSSGYFTGRYKITSYGLEEFEKLLYPSEANRRAEQRKIIMETLEPLYRQDPNAEMDNAELATKTGLSNFYELSAIVHYLHNRGHVVVHDSMGQHFEISLTALGYESLQRHEYDAIEPTVAAYRMFFKLENNLRRFVERKLREAYGPDWWKSKAVSHAIRKQVEDMQNEERKLGWQVSQTQGITDYLLFDQLDGLINNNWNEVFKPVFKDLQWVQSRLKELIGIRNAILRTNFGKEPRISRRT